MTTTPPPVMQNQFPLIAGKNAGIRISCTPQAKPVYDNLLRLSKSGNYWAQLIVNGIQGLASGRLHLNNVFVKEEKLAQGEFIMVLPGCVATFEKRDTGEFRLIHMTADESYFELQKQHKRPGLYRVKKSDEKRYVAKIAVHGRVKEEKNRVVAITDRRGYAPEQVAKSAESYISGTPVSTDSLALELNGYDLHFTPGNGGIGGWRNLHQALRADTDRELHESAILLAKTMYEARDVDGVRWIAEHGGSGVLIQAMRILVDQGVKLDKHVVFLNHPTTLKSKIVPLGSKLGLRPLRKLTHSNPLHPGEMIGGLFFGSAGYIAAYKRLRYDKNYSGLKFIGDIVKETGNLQGAGAPIGAVTTALGFSTGIGSVPALMAFSTAVLVIKTGSQLTEAWLPRIYNKIKGKF